MFMGVLAKLITPSYCQPKLSGEINCALINLLAELGTYQSVSKEIVMVKFNNVMEFIMRFLPCHHIKHISIYVLI